MMLQETLRDSRAMAGDGKIELGVGQSLIHHDCRCQTSSDVFEENSDY